MPYVQGVGIPDVEVRRSRRRRRTVSAYREGGRTIVLIPARFTKAEERQWVATMLDRLATGDRRRRPSDAELASRAEELSRRYLGGVARPTSIRWVANQQLPLGLVHARRRHDPDLDPGQGHAGLRPRLRDAARAGPPARRRATARTSGRCWAATRASSGPAATSRASRRRPGSTWARTTGGRRGARGGRDWRRRDWRSGVSRVAARAASHQRADLAGALLREAPSTGHHATSRDSSLTAYSAPSGTTPA